MKKRMIGMSVVAAAMTVAMSIPAFAMGWTQEGDKWKYYSDDYGNFISGQWFTDPADGSMYHLDPDGYAMTETRVDGYWLDASGRRIEKTEAEIKREADKVTREASKPSPGKEQTAATAAGKAAKSASSATSNTRLAYQAEMKVFMDKIYIENGSSLMVIRNAEIAEAAKAVEAANAVNAAKAKAEGDDEYEDEDFNEDSVDTVAISTDITNTITEFTYRFMDKNQKNIIASTVWPVATAKSNGFKDQAFETHYNRGLLSRADEMSIYDGTFKKLAIAALGETAGNDAYNFVFEQLNTGVYNFEITNTTDMGNSYTLICGNGIISFTVTCTEQFHDTAAEAAANTAATAPEAETAVTASKPVITVGAGKSDAANSDYEEDDASDDDYEEAEE